MTKPATRDALAEAERSARSLSLSIVLTLLAVGAAAAFLASCGSLDAQYVEADRATYDSISPWVREKADPEADAAKILVLDSWKLRLETAEGSLR